MKDPTEVIRDNWAAIADWAEFRAKVMRNDADLAEKLVGNPPSFAYAASLRKAANVMEDDAKRWRFEANQITANNHIPPARKDDE